MMEISVDLCEWGREKGGISLVITPSLPHPFFPVQPQSDEAVRVCLRERGNDVLVLQRISSATARGGGRVEARNGR